MDETESGSILRQSPPIIEVASWAAEEREGRRGGDERDRRRVVSWKNGRDPEPDRWFSGWEDRRSVFRSVMWGADWSFGV
jgi:hypothetical protein